MTKENLETRFDNIMKQKVNTTTYNKSKINKNIFSKFFNGQLNKSETGFQRTRKNILKHIRNLKMPTYKSIKALNLKRRSRVGVEINK